jgi:tetratricopeptide (TPR) repeat protein
MAEGTDSLVFLSDLTYRNKTEKEIFYRLNGVKNKDELLDLFLFISPIEDSISLDATVKKFNHFVQKLKVSNNSEDEKNKINELIEHIKRTFLKTESSVSNLRETIEQGKYNCYTAAALYGLIFSKLNIPYQITENPNTLDLIVYPEDRKIELEFKILNSKCFDFPEHFRNKWAKSMFYAKLIPYEEFEKGYTVELFEKYYFKSNTLSLIQLASVMLCHLSIQSSDEKKLQNALYYMQKSYLLDPSDRNQVSLKYHIFNAIGNFNYENKLDFTKLIYLCKYINLGDIEITTDFINSEFLRYLNVQLDNKTDLDTIVKYYNVLIKSSNNSTIKDQLSYTYYMAISKKLIFDENKSKDELIYLMGAFSIKPEDKDLLTLIIASINSKLQKTGESVKAIKIVDEYCKHFKMLNQIVSISIIKSHCYLDIASLNFAQGLIEEGDVYLKKSEQLCNNKLVKPNEDLVEKGYVTAAKYYFNKGNKLKAKEYLIRGLEYAPNSKLIQDKLKLMQ